MNHSRRRFIASFALLCGFVLSSAVLVRPRQGPTQRGATSDARAATPVAHEKALRLNTLGVAYMNQQRPGDAQKYFEQALGAEPSFAVARLNLGIAFMAQQKLEEARAALEAAVKQLPQDPYAWYNLGLAYKDLGEAEKGAAAFSRVTEIVPGEADPYYFVGYAQTQLQKYPEAIAAFQQALALYPYHASAEFGLARALQRKGDTAAAREHLTRFQKITTEHLGTPFGAGYGDQGRFSLAELVRGDTTDAPRAIAVRFAPQSAFDGANVGPSTGACFFDYNGDGKPDLFLVSGSAEGTSHRPGSASRQSRSPSRRSR